MPTQIIPHSERIPFRTSCFGFPARACCIDSGMEYEVRRGVWLDQNHPRAKAEAESERDRAQSFKARATNRDGFPA